MNNYYDNEDSIWIPKKNIVHRIYYIYIVKNIHLETKNLARLQNVLF